MSAAAHQPQLIVGDPRPGIRLLTLNRPDARNALSTSLLTGIAVALDSVREDDAVRCVVITGGDTVFSAGADIKELAKRTSAAAIVDVRPNLWDRIRKFPKPLIAAVNGYALGGGCELAMLCDITVAGAGAAFGQPEVNLGILPAAGGTQRLVRLAGRQLAMKWVMTGTHIEAREARAAGVVAEVVADDQTLERALALAEVIAEKPPLAVRLAKEVLNAAQDAPLEAGLALEHKACAALLATADFNEGVAAFLEKRRPKFQGR